MYIHIIYLYKYILYIINRIKWSLYSYQVAFVTVLRNVYNTMLRSKKSDIAFRLFSMLSYLKFDDHIVKFKIISY